ncbi:uncharacterized protein LACBIDRAFT_329800 [Laccaria bicolor S238N-H82]|uniref:Predicted protein n=1 Tax=Laccaria bicolor (strain S238N-H82 / ATCC MYA-4686) TaxID=486041 RepID=B0DJ98_LACBS|nr:uncharacterized protein LACBIDRAFT_329800 [Laccaria bicolor S238N-H82]EDR05366.1 predicted protein [Laccaria bicolor S238N-H82]|eukprot:XP_001883924.1 predicted protein [Laccaria bicolor S238N-H82]
MQTIETYTPSLPNLHLTPFQSINTVADDVNPLYYRLTTDNFIVLTLPSGQLLYALDPATGTSLWWALRRIARVITRAAIHSIAIDPFVPVTQRGYIPQFQFDRISMQRPAVLSTLSPDCMNPLYGYTSRENIQAWFTDFQNMGRQAIQWIRAARYQSAHLRLHSGWNWDVLPQDSARLEFPDRYLIKGPDARIDSNSYSVPSICSSSASDSSSEVSSFTFDEDIIMGGIDDDDRSLVLHPLLSAYAKHYTDYDVFSKEPLIDNGYVESRLAGNSNLKDRGGCIPLRLYLVLLGMQVEPNSFESGEMQEEYTNAES